MNSIDFPQLAFEFDKLINGSFVQQIFSSSSLSKAESLLLEFILENDPSPKGGLDCHKDQNDQKDNDQSLQQQQKIHQIKTKLILSLQGPYSSSSSSSSSLSEDQQHDDETNGCQIVFQGLVEKVFSFQQRLRDFSSESSDPKTTHIEQNYDISRSPFDSWSDSDCQLLLEEIGTRRSTIQSIQNRLQREVEKSLCRPLHSIHRSLGKFLSSSLSSSDLVSECQKELPELSREQMSRLLIGVEMLSLGFGIVQIPQWWIDQEQMKPMEERNLLSINNGSEQVTHWMEINLSLSIEQQLIEEEKQKMSSSLINSRPFSGCQTLYFLEDIFSCLWYKGDKRSVKEVMMAEKQRLFGDLEKQLVIIGNSDYDPEMEDRNIHFFDPISRIQRKLSNQVGTWSPSPSPSYPSSFGIQITAESANESLSPSSAVMSLKIHSIMDEIYEIKRQHECKQEDEEESNQKRIQSNLPPKVECAWDILQSLLKRETFNICFLSQEDIARIPKEIRYLNRKDFDRIELKGNQVEWLIDRLCLIFSDEDSEEKREIGLKIRRVSTQELPSLFSKISKRSSLSRTMHFSTLDLEWNQLRSVPTEIIQLENLHYLSLSFNQLTSVPAEIGQLTNLQTLHLSSNQLTSVPAEIGQLTNLQMLHLSSNRFISVSTEIGQLTNLQTLHLSSNQLTSMPAEIGQLTNLQTLWLGSNQLTSMPAEIGQLTNLQTLYLNQNQLTSVPAEITQLESLHYLHLSSNQLTLVPAEIGQLTNLQTLWLSYNQLTSVPAEIGQLANLQTLHLSSNRLTSVPVEIGQLANLQSLWLSYNLLTSVPAKIGQLMNLPTLNLGRNQLTSVPAEIGRLMNLQTLNLSSNRLISVTAEISQLTNLQTLNLGQNQLTSVPAEISQLKILRTLHLQNNQLSSIQAEIGKITNLQTLWVSSNQLTSVPAEISQLEKLQALHLQNNPNLTPEFRNRDHSIFSNLKNLDVFKV